MGHDAIIEQADCFRKNIRRRNFYEYLAVVFVCWTFGRHGLAAHTTVLKLGDALVVGGALFVAWQLHFRASATDIPAHLPAPAFFEAYRVELRRQLDALQKVPFWYLAPFVPGMCLIIAGRTMERHDASWGPLMGVSAVILAVFCGVWVINRLAAQRLRVQIAGLERAVGETG
jgi:hypothetical protein